MQRREFTAGVAATAGLWLFGTSAHALSESEALEVTVRADEAEFGARVRLDTPREREYYRHGGILCFVLRRLLAAG